MDCFQDARSRIAKVYTRAFGTHQSRAIVGSGPAAEHTKKSKCCLDRAQSKEQTWQGIEIVTL